MSRPQLYFFVAVILLVAWLAECQSPSPPAPSNLVITVDGHPVSGPSTTTLNMVSGKGFLWVCSATTATVTNCTADANTAWLMSRPLDISNDDHWCADTSNTVGAFVCKTPSPANWVGYVPGNWVMLRVGTQSSIGPASLNVNNVGLHNIKLVDGTTDPGPRLIHSGIYLLVMDDGDGQPNNMVWRMSRGDSI